MFSPQLLKLVRKLLVLGVLMACLVVTSTASKGEASLCCFYCKQSYDACIESGENPFDCESAYYSCISGCPLECPWLPY